MSQHDYTLENESGLLFRQNANAALLAIVTQNSGATEPATTYPFMPWVDTSSTPTLKIRNAANDAWTVIGPVEQIAFGLRAPISTTTEPTPVLPFQPWIDTSGANPIWKVRNAANSAWIAMGRADLPFYNLAQQDVATSATIAALSNLTSIVRMTGSTATAIQGITASSPNKVVTIHNSSSAVVTIKHNDASASANNRFDIGADLDLEPGQAASFWEDTSSNRWKFFGGAGSGGGSNVVTNNLTLTNGDQLAISLTKMVQTFNLSGSSAAVTLNTLPFGSSAPKNGAIFYLSCHDNTKTVTIPANDSAKGILMDGDLTLYLGHVRAFMYNQTLDRYLLIGA